MSSCLIRIEARDNWHSKCQLSHAVCTLWMWVSLVRQMRSCRCCKWYCICSRRLDDVGGLLTSYNQCTTARVRVQWSHCVGTAIKVWRLLCVHALNWITRQAGQARSHLHLLGQLHVQVHLHVSRPLLIFGCNRKLWTSFGRKRKIKPKIRFVFTAETENVPTVQFWSFSAPKTNFGRSLVPCTSLFMT